MDKEDVYSFIRGKGATSKVVTVTAKETWSHSFDDVHTVYFGGLPDNEMMVSQTGTFGNSRIQRHLSDGSTSETKWNGECKVKVGEMVSLNTLTGQISSREMTKKEKKKALKGE